jgi:hypothetical protein
MNSEIVMLVSVTVVNVLTINHVLNVEKDGFSCLVNVLRSVRLGMFKETMTVLNVVKNQTVKSACLVTCLLALLALRIPFYIKKNAFPSAQQVLL